MKKWTIGTAALIPLFAIQLLRADKPAATQPATTRSSTRPTTRTATDGVTLINLHLKKASAQQVFEQLGKQSGVDFSAQNNLWDQPDMQDDFDVDMVDKPFWSAVDEVCGEFRVKPEMFGQPFYAGGAGGFRGTRIVTLMPASKRGSAAKMPVFEKDGFVVRATGFTRNQTVNYEIPEGSFSHCGVSVMVLVDPAIHISSFSNSPNATEALDDKGHSMLPEAGGATTYNGGLRQPSLYYTCNVPLKFPDEAGKKIASLKFTLQMRGSTSVDKLTVDEPLDSAEVTKDFGDTTIVFHSMKKGTRPGSFELKVGVISDNDQFDFNSVYNVLQSAQLLDAKGKPFFVSPGGGGGGGGSMEYTLNYSTTPNGIGMPMRNDRVGTGIPAKWVLEMPTKPHSIKLPVEFKDLPLP